MKKEGYILGKIKPILKKNYDFNVGYINALFALFSDFVNFSYTDEGWINKDHLFCDDEKILNAFFKILNLKQDIDKPCNLGIAAGLSLGKKKVNNVLNNKHKNLNLLNYKNYLVCDIEKLSDGNFLNIACYTQNRAVDDLVLIAINKSGEKPTKIANIYEEVGFDINILKNNKIKTITDSIKDNKKSKTPVLIIVNSTDTYDIEEDDDFNFYNLVRKRMDTNYKTWLLEYDKVIESRSEDTLEAINYLKNPKIKIDLENIEFKLDASYENTIVNSSEKIYGILKGKSEFISLVKINDSKVACMIAAGLSLTGIKPCIKIKSFNEISDLIYICHKYEFPITFIMESADEDIYMPNLNVFYPGDMYEVIGSWSTIIKQNKTAILVLSDKETTLVKDTNVKYVKYGGYMIKRETSTMSGVIVASGEELKFALGVAGLLEKENIFMRVVTMPCPNLLLKQVKYEKELLHRSVKIFVIDKNLSVINNKFTTSNQGLISSRLGLDKVKELIKIQLV